MRNSLRKTVTTHDKMNSVDESRRPRQLPLERNEISGASKLQGSLSSHSLEDSKPSFIFYVGIPKTATTFIQCTICANIKVTRPILLKDNYEYIGTCPFRACGIEETPSEQLRHRRNAFFKNAPQLSEGMGPILHHPRKGDHISSGIELSDEFREKVSAVFKRRHNAVMVFEGAHVFPDNLIQSLSEYLTPQWNVKIVVGYRPLYDWLPSKYNSVYKNDLDKSWPGKPDLNDRNIAKEVLPFDLDDRGKFSSMVHSFENVYHKHPTEIVRDNFLLYFRDVVILALNKLPEANGKGDPILENFFCTIVPNASQICRDVQDGAMNFPSSRNPSVSFDEDLLAVAAYRRGNLLGKWQEAKPGNRAVVRYAIAEYYRQELNNITKKASSSYTFPLICWSNNKLKRLNDLSLQLERQLFSSTWSDEQGVAHTHGFQEAWSKKKFCSIDTHKALRQEVWQRFFTSDSLFRYYQGMKENSKIGFANSEK